MVCEPGLKTRASLPLRPMLIRKAVSCAVMGIQAQPHWGTADAIMQRWVKHGNFCTPLVFRPGNGNGPPVRIKESCQLRINLFCVSDQQNSRDPCTHVISMKKISSTELECFWSK
ncbi:hypothetical protein Ancab_013101 [Ancistrocladus abbreviatus]